MSQIIEDQWINEIWDTKSHIYKLQSENRSKPQTVISVEQLNSRSLGNEKYESGFSIPYQPIQTQSSFGDNFMDRDFPDLTETKPTSESYAAQNNFEDRGATIHRRLITKKSPLQKSTQKNTLQNVGCLLNGFLKHQKKFNLSYDQLQLIRQVKTYKNIKEFNKLFALRGNVRKALAHFFLPNTFWEIVLNSKIRSYQAKLALKQIGIILRRSFINGGLKNLS